jgi:hypothetical protein
MRSGLGVRSLARTLGKVRQGFVAIAAPTSPACFQRPQGLLKGFLERATNGHGLPYRLHLGCEDRVTAGKFLKGKPGDFGDHIVNGGLKTGRGFLGNVVGDFTLGCSPQPAWPQIWQWGTLSPWMPGPNCGTPEDSSQSRSRPHFRGSPRTEY